MKKFIIILLGLFCLLSQECLAENTPEKINGMSENGFILDEMLPNPNIFLYGEDSNGFPILLINFSSTIPFYTITDDTNRIKRFLPFWRTKVSSLKFINLYLTFDPYKDSPCKKNFYYKILKIQCKEISQQISHQSSNTFTVRAEPQYSGMSAGYVQDEYRKQSNYDAQQPIITYSGIGTDTLKIMLKRGRKYRIPSGHIDVSMVILAVPYYDPPLTNDTLKCYDYVSDFLNYSEVTQENCKEIRTAMIKKMPMKKIYMDNRVNSYFEASPEHNPENLIIKSEIIKGSRMNCVNPSNTISFTSKQTIEKDSKGEIIKNNTEITKTKTETSCKEILKDTDFMYDGIIDSSLMLDYNQALNKTPTVVAPAK